MKHNLQDQQIAYGWFDSNPFMESTEDLQGVFLFIVIKVLDRGHVDL